MPAGAVALPVLDGTATSRNVLTWSSTGLIGGNLSPLQGILGADGLNIAAAGNGFAVTIENASIAVTSAQSSIKSAQVAIAVTNTAVAFASQALVAEVTVKANTANANPLYVGPSGVTSATGYPLYPGDRVTLAVTNANEIFIVGVTVGDFAAYVGN